VGSHSRKEDNTKTFLVVIGVSIITALGWCIFVNLKDIYNSRESDEVKNLKITVSLLAATVASIVVGLPLFITNACAAGWIIGIAILAASAVMAITSFLLQQYDRSPPLSAEMRAVLRPIEIFLETEKNNPQTDAFGAVLDNPDAYRDYVRETVRRYIYEIATPKTNPVPAAQNYAFFPPSAPNLEDLQDDRLPPPYKASEAHYPSLPKYA
jgi:hypothetical protein